MFDTIWHALKDEFGISEMSSVVSGLSNLISELEEDYFKDKNAKNAVIDAVCKILQEHKDVNDG